MAALKTRLAPAAARVERLFDRLGRRRPRKAGTIDAYIGYSEPEALVARGRVLASDRDRDPQEGQRWYRNLAQMISLFLTDEVADVEVRAEGMSTRTDEEGYFTLRLPRPEGAQGWVTVTVDAPVAAELPVLVSNPAADYGVISDIDDTMMKTGAYSIWRNLWTSMTGNALTRHVFPDAVDLMERLQDGVNPVFYVSSSPWNLHGFLEEVFARNELLRGPKFLRDLGISETQFVTGTHGDHKGAAIDRIMGANPGLGFVLVGDTGQHDAEVYLAAAERHEGRVRRVILRAPGRGADAKDMDFVRKIEALGIPVHVDADYRKVIAVLEDQRAVA
ncbi:phosphatase domain-containing protein [Aestuariibius sp. 2305UL40-4]|uniref:phosphatase domain-containing protein n=1 Tax=Aestuariibius violaceus TaxID=3234132 RepID=UPI00345EC5E9